MPIFLVILSYLLGSIPFGYIVGRWQKIDIRQYGSGNVGATNIFRTLGLVPGIIVFGADLLKGTLVVILVQGLGQDPWIVILCALAAVVGHSFSIFLNFKGGRGVATGLGILLGIAPDLFLFAVLLFVIVLALTRYVSASSIFTSVTIAIAFFLLAKPLPYSVATLLIVILIVARHRPNIKRLLAGTEPRIGEKKE